MPLRTTLALSSTCSKLHQASRQRWTVDSRLSRFVKSPLCLRSELGRHASLISGSFALQFFAQETWPESDLDIFVEQGVPMICFERYLKEEESYVLDSTVEATDEERQSRYEMGGILQVCHTLLIHPSLHTDFFSDLYVLSSRTLRFDKSYNSDHTHGRVADLDHYIWLLYDRRHERNLLEQSLCAFSQRDFPRRKDLYAQTLGLLL